MNDNLPRATLIATLSDNLAPVAPVRPQWGLALVLGATLVAAFASVAGFGFWTGILYGDASGFFWITNGMLLVLGMSSSAALVAGALPRVGARSGAPLWSALMLAVIPAAALITVFAARDRDPASSLGEPALAYWPCIAAALAAALLIGAAATAFLRRGAPVSPERSGWLTGLAGGALGTLAYGITCPLDSIGHVGLLHTAPVALAAIAGRLAVPPLIRW
ncbi:NrsF family protein [Qipengyuania nanhaisediminis]|uniref:NrsF family protein n=1 Tax=Qipengyuania nanhaisediminis TaxID=604088 RepID=UPI0038B299EC